MLILEQAEELRLSLAGDEAENESTTPLEAMIMQALETVAGRFELGKNLALTVACAGSDDGYTLHPEEARLLSPRACRKRRLNWTLGRAAASRSLRKLGFEDPPPVLRGDRGEPLWPEGISGSITHCDPWSVAVSAEGSNPLAVGIDLESLERFQETDVSGLICRKAELEWARGVGDFQTRLAMLFSAKEALYKSLYPFVRRYVDFTEVELSWSPERFCFHAEVLPSDACGFDSGPVAISCRRHQHWIFSCSIYESKSFSS